MTALLPVPVTWLLLSLAAGCSGEDGDACGEEPAYGGDATDEAWRTMVDGDQDALVGDSNAPQITSPAEGQVLSTAGPAPRFTWTSAIASLDPARGRSGSRMAHSRANRDHRSPLSALASLVEGTAWAHLPPVTGDIYYVRITVPGSDCEIRALTTDLEWQVDEESWSAMKAASGDLSCQITSAYLQENRITEGPYRPTEPRTFRVGP